MYLLFLYFWCSVENCTSRENGDAVNFWEASYDIEWKKYKPTSLVHLCILLETLIAAHIILVLFHKMIICEIRKKFIKNHEFCHKSFVLLYVKSIRFFGKTQKMMKNVSNKNLQKTWVLVLRL